MVKDLGGFQGLRHRVFRLGVGGAGHLMVTPVIKGSQTFKTIYVQRAFFVGFGDTAGFYKKEAAWLDRTRV